MDLAVVGAIKHWRYHNAEFPNKSTQSVLRNIRASATHVTIIRSFEYVRFQSSTDGVQFVAALARHWTCKTYFRLHKHLPMDIRTWNKMLERCNMGPLNANVCITHSLGSSVSFTNTSKPKYQIEGLAQDWTSASMTEGIWHVHTHS